MRADLAAAADQRGCACLIRAKRPATCGLDIDVPLIDWNSSPGTPKFGTGVLPARTFTPGAVTSGLMMSSATVFEPRDEKLAIQGASISVNTPPLIWATAASPVAAM